MNPTTCAFCDDDLVEPTHGALAAYCGSCGRVTPLAASSRLIEAAKPTRYERFRTWLCQRGIKHWYRTTATKYNPPACKHEHFSITWFLECQVCHHKTTVWSPPL